MVQKQTLFMAVLVALSLGFIVGASYTSFRLADEQQPMQSKSVPGNKEKSSGPEPAMAQANARIKNLEKQVKENPSDIRAWIELGNLNFDAKQAEQAIFAYGHALSLDPDNSGVLTDLGVMYRQNGQPKKAVETFDRAIAVDPDFETAFFNKGIVLMHDLKNMEGAMQAWEALLKINPEAAVPGGGRIKDMVERIKSRQ